MTCEIRLLRAIQAAVPGVQNISLVKYGQPDQVLVIPADLQAAAQPTINAFDWSDAAQKLWEEDQMPERKGIRQAAAQAISDIDTYLALATPTNAQVVAQVRRLSQISKQVIKRLIQID